MEPSTSLARPPPALSWSSALAHPDQTTTPNAGPSSSDLLDPPPDDPPELTPDDPSVFRRLQGMLVERDAEQRKREAREGERGLSHWRWKKLALDTNSGTLIATTRGPNPEVALESKPLYVRLMMMVIWNGRPQQMILNTHKASVLSEKETVKQGRKFDSPRHALKNIRAFVKAYHIDLSELLLPNLTDYKTFNEFFYRRLKPNARPIASPRSTRVISSMADCRLTVFDSIQSAQRFWIKGREFSLRELIGNDKVASEFEGGMLAIFRLAPADYHRYHAPCDGTVGKSWTISGTYLTVDPMVVKDADLNVFGTNRRDVTLLTPVNEGDQGQVALVQIGALLVGSVNRTVKEGETVKRGQDFGYFAYEGSTVVMVAERGAVEWDEDLLTNSRAALETQVKVGDRIGRWAS